MVWTFFDLQLLKKEVWIALKSSFAQSIHLALGRTQREASCLQTGIIFRLNPFLKGTEAWDYFSDNLVCKRMCQKFEIFILIYCMLNIAVLSFNWRPIFEPKSKDIFELCNSSLLIKFNNWKITSCYYHDKNWGHKTVWKITVKNVNLIFLPPTNHSSKSKNRHLLLMLFLYLLKWPMIIRTLAFCVAAWNLFIYLFIPN